MEKIAVQKSDRSFAGMFGITEEREMQLVEIISKAVDPLNEQGEKFAPVLALEAIQPQCVNAQEVAYCVFTMGMYMEDTISKQNKAQTNAIEQLINSITGGGKQTRKSAFQDACAEVYETMCKTIKNKYEKEYGLSLMRPIGILEIGGHKYEAQMHMCGDQRMFGPEQLNPKITAYRHAHPLEIIERVDPVLEPIKTEEPATGPGPEATGGESEHQTNQG